MKSIRSPLDRCFIADLLVSEHAAYSGRCKITLQSWRFWIVCFLIDLRCRLSPFRTFHRTILSTRIKSSRSFTMRAFKITGLAFCSLVCCNSAIAELSAFLFSDWPSTQNQPFRNISLHGLVNKNKTSALVYDASFLNHWFRLLLFSLLLIGS